MPSLNTKLASAPNTQTNYVLKATSSTTIGNSTIQDTGSLVTVTSPTDIVTGSGIGSSGVTGLLRVVTAGTSTGIAIGQANSSRYTAIQPNEHIIYNDDFFMRTNGAFPLSLGTNNTIRMSITSAGNVGIGTSSPSALLTLAKDNVIGINTTDGADNGYLALAGAGGDGDNRGGHIYLSGNERGADAGTAIIAAGSVGSIQFRTGASVERMRITAAGSLTIGAVPDSSMRLSVQGAYDNWTSAFWASTATGASYGPLVYAGTTSGDWSFYVASASGANWYFRVRGDGNVYVNGALSKGSGSFRIDHPLESMSDTHELVHSFIEGPQADLIYRGKLTLVNGKAQANIDEVSTMTEGTFEALCREVQCFTTNESGWDAVRGKVIGNIIYIESNNSNSNDEISWMVIGERKDKHMLDTGWTDENGKVIVEPLKTNEPDILPK